MKYCVLIIDGASGWPLPRYGRRTCLEMARTPNLDEMVNEGVLGLVRNVPPGMEASSACACMSVLGYDPRVYYKGRSGIEAHSMGVPVDQGEVVLRCNLVSVSNGRMQSYCAGHISTEEAQLLISALEEGLGDDDLHFYPGVSYRHLCKIVGHEDVLEAKCTPPHDIPGKPIEEHLPQGPGSDFLRNLMERSKLILQDHPVNKARCARGDVPATMAWLFWASGRIPEMPSFRDIYSLGGAMTSGVDLLKGLASMVDMTVLDIPGVTGGQDNDYSAQAVGALEALGKHDMVVVHVEAPDEAGHEGHVEQKVEAIEMVDRDMVKRFQAWKEGPLRIMVLPDHPTPITLQTHVDDPVPFLLWGPGFSATGNNAYSETEAKYSGVYIEEGCTLMGRLVDGWQPASR
ncbi:cofactor-independent phosphoglycerate mutase [Chloroflexota bacterium]